MFDSEMVKKWYDPCANIELVIVKSKRPIKKFYNRTRIRISRLSKIPTLFPDWSRSLNLEKGYLFDCIEREEDFKDTSRNTQNAALNVDLF